jgi:RND family efflux transporter MFP subunit
MAARISFPPIQRALSSTLRSNGRRVCRQRTPSLLSLHNSLGSVTHGSVQRSRIGHALGALLLAVMMAACKKGDAATADSSGTPPAGDSAAAAAEEAGRPALALPVAAEEAREADLVLRVNTTGQVRSDATVKLRAEVAGTVSQVLVRPGARVSRGQALVRFDMYPFELAVREAQAAADESEQRFIESFVPESLVTGKGPTSEQRKALMIKSGLTGARVRLDRARYDHQRATITSPVDGVVDAIDVAAGERIGGGQQLLTVVDTRNLRIEAQVLEHDLPLLRVGGEAMITSAGAPGRIIRGRVDAVLPLVDSVTRAGRAIVRVPGDGTLRPGMYADVQLEAARLPKRRLVPSRAVIERDGRPLVFVVKDGRAQWTYIVPGRTNGVETEVLPDSTTGLIPVNAGDQVIVEGHLTLTHDAPVRIAAPRERAPAESSAVRPRRSPTP